MTVSLRVILGICFLIGALLFFYRGENHYALIFLLVGALYLYKGLRWGLNLVINFSTSRIEWISFFSDINVTIFFFSKAVDWFYSLFRAKKRKEEKASLNMIDHILSFFVSNKKALAILFMIICLAFIYPGMFKFLYFEGRDFGRSLVNSILS